MSSRKDKKALSMKDALEEITHSQKALKKTTKEKRGYDFRDWLWSYPVNFERAFKKSSPLSFILLFVLIAFGIFTFLTSELFANVFFPKKKNVFVEGNVGAISTFNPLFISQNPVDSDIQALVFEKFIDISNEGDPLPKIATDWKQSEDGVTYDFTISQDHVWQDSEPLTIDDILFTFEVSKELAQKLNYDTVGIPLVDVAIEKISDTELRFTLPERNATFFETISIYIVPKHRFEDIRLEDIPFDSFAKFPLGSGPFEVYRSEPNVVYLRASEYYKPIPKIQTFIYRLYSDYSSLEAAFRNGILDAIGGTDAASMGYISEYSGYSVYSETIYPRVKMIFFNTRTEKYKSRDIRLALNLLIDKDRLLQEANLIGESAYGPIPESSWAYSEKETQKHLFNQQKASELLKNIGYTKNEESGYFETEDRKILSLTLSYYECSLNTRLVNTLKDILFEEGIILELEPLTYTQLTQEIVATRDFELLLFEIETTIDPDQYNLWHSLKSDYPDLNISGYSYERIDILLEEARRTIAREKRTESYALFQKYFTQDMPVMFLYYPNYTYIVRSTIDIPEMPHFVYPCQRFENISSWSY